MTRVPPPAPIRLCLKALAAAASLVALVACGGGPAPGPAKAVIQAKGSDTMVNVAQVWAEEYARVAPDTEVEVSGGGSGVGIAALVRGAVDIANASRDIKPAEAEQATKNTGTAPGSSSSASTRSPCTSTRRQALSQAKTSTRQILESSASNRDGLT